MKSPIFLKKVKEFSIFRRNKGFFAEKRQCKYSGIIEEQSEFRSRFHRFFGVYLYNEKGQCKYFGRGNKAFKGEL